MLRNSAASDSCNLSKHLFRLKAIAINGHGNDVWGVRILMMRCNSIYMFIDLRVTTISCSVRDIISVESIASGRWCVCDLLAKLTSFECCLAVWTKGTCRSRNLAWRTCGSWILIHCCWKVAGGRNWRTVKAIISTLFWDVVFFVRWNSIREA